MNLDFSQTNVILVVITLVLSVTLHEAMHAFASYWLGDDTAKEEGRLSLNPLRHIDLYSTVLLPVITYLVFHFPVLAAKPVPFNPNRVRFGEYGAALVGLAGPFTNLFPAGVGALIFRLVASPDITSLAIQGLLTFVRINVVLFVFNMVPIPPLDGSRLIYALVPESIQEVMASFERYGIMLVFLLLITVPAFSLLLFAIDNAILRVLL